MALYSLLSLATPFLFFFMVSGCLILWINTVFGLSWISVFHSLWIFTLFCPFQLLFYLFYGLKLPEDFFLSIFIGLSWIRKCFSLLLRSKGRVLRGDVWRGKRLTWSLNWKFNVHVHGIFLLFIPSLYCTFLTGLLSFSSSHTWLPWVLETLLLWSIKFVIAVAFVLGRKVVFHMLNRSVTQTWMSL